MSASKEAERIAFSCVRKIIVDLGWACSALVTTREAADFIIAPKHQAEALSTVKSSQDFRNYTGNCIRVELKGSISQKQMNFLGADAVDEEGQWRRKAFLESATRADFMIFCRCPSLPQYSLWAVQLRGKVDYPKFLENVSVYTEDTFSDHKIPTLTAENVGSLKKALASCFITKPTMPPSEDDLKPRYDKDVRESVKKQRQ